MSIMPPIQDHPTSESEAANEAWIKGLLGQSHPSDDPMIHQEAQAIRRGFLARRVKLEATIPKADDMLFDQIRFRIRREQSAAKGHRWNKPSVWGLAASLVLGVAVVFQMAGPGFDDDLWGRFTNGDTMRSTPATETVQLVDDPQARRDELVATLKRAGAEPKVKQDLAKGEVIIQVQATQAVRDALGSDDLRIYPDVQDGWITLVLKPAKPKSVP